MHWPPRDNGPGLEEAWRAMNDLKKEGKVRWVGVSNFDAEQMKRAAEIAPMTSGLLTGAMTRERAAALPPDDFRSRNPEFKEPRLSTNIELVERLRKVGVRHG